ncbi:Cyt-b5 [Symbiodinium sp. CCMP2456]|nr:Cyt-b5 [Symbiodinium sp. CCMP2456]
MESHRLRTRGTSVAGRCFNTDTRMQELYMRGFGGRCWRRDAPAFGITSIPRCSTGARHEYGQCDSAWLPPQPGDLAYLEGRKSVTCKLQTASFACINWDKVAQFWLPIGENTRGWSSLMFLAAVLLLGGRYAQTTTEADKLEEISLCQVNFWCRDLPPHRSIYLAMAGALLWLGAMLDHPTFDEAEETPVRPYALPWLAIFTPAAACILVMATSSPQARQKSVWHLAASVLLLPAVLAFIFREREHTMGANHGTAI